MRKPMDRNLAFELVRVTEAAAMAAAHWMGRGNKESADQAAVDAMRFALQSVDMDGIVVIGDGAKTFSLAMRARSGTVRIVEATHKLDKLARISGG